MLCEEQLGTSVTSMGCEDNAAVRASSTHWRGLWLEVRLLATPGGRGVHLGMRQTDRRPQATEHS